jgi:hypothetical protein
MRQFQQPIVIFWGRFQLRGLWNMSSRTLKD